MQHSGWNFNVLVAPFAGQEFDFAPINIFIIIISNGGYYYEQFALPSAEVAGQLNQLAVFFCGSFSTSRR